jgi:hypothetical protein
MSAEFQCVVASGRKSLYVLYKQKEGFYNKVILFEMNQPTGCSN